MDDEIILKNHKNNDVRVSYVASASPVASISVGVVILKKTPTGKDKGRITPSIVLGFKKKHGVVTHLNLLWMKEVKDSNELSKYKDDRYVVIKEKSIFEKMGFNNPIIIDKSKPKEFPITKELFPYGAISGNYPLIDRNTPSKVPIPIIGVAPKHIIIKLKKTHTELYNHEADSFPIIPDIPLIDPHKTLADKLGTGLKRVRYEPTDFETKVGGIPDHKLKY